MQKISKDFPILDQYIYANTATTGIMYDGLLDWRQEHDLDYLIGGSNFKLKAAKLLEDTRTVVGRFFNCKAENVALVQNFSLGLNILLEGLDKKHKVLMIEEDYPSLKWPFLSRDFEVSCLQLSSKLEDDILKTIKEKNISVLALSLIQWINGFKIDLSFLQKLKKEFPELLIIADATQYCGTESFDFETSGIDVLGASAYKWLLSGAGNGFLLFKEDVKSKFSLSFSGFNSASGNLDGKDKFPFIKHFEPGHLDTLAFGSLKFSLEYLTSIGMENITKHNKEISNQAFKEFKKLNVLDETVIDRDEHSTIFNVKGGQKLFDTLTNNDIMCTQRGDGIRLSFHFYNSMKNVNKVIDIIKKMK